MNPEGGRDRMWRKLAKKDLILGPRVNGYLHSMSAEARDMIAALQDRLDDEFTIRTVRSMKDPNTLELYCSVELIKTEKK